MEVHISLSVIMFVKFIAFFVFSAILAMFCLFPINDKPTTITQIMVYIIFEALLLSVMFGFLTFSVGP